MDVRQLRYFVTVAELRHFGKAAQRLHIVQPAVSQQIARLERELSLTLFDRSHRQIALTADGQAFLPHARRVLRALDRAANAAADLAAGAGGLLRVGSSEGLSPRLDQILAAFRQQHPSATVQLSAGTTPAKLAAVAAGDLDAAFVRAPEPHSGVRLHQLWNEPLLLALPVGFPGDRAELSALADLPLAQTPRDHNPGMFDLVVAACRAAGFSPKAGPQLGRQPAPVRPARLPGRPSTAHIGPATDSSTSQGPPRGRITIVLRDSDRGPRQPVVDDGARQP